MNISSLPAEPLAVLVDDDPAVRDALANLLDSVGVESIAFASTRELLEAVLPDRPACFVLDVRMPGVGGLELQHQLAGQGVCTPIIFLTGHGDIPMSVEAMKAGAVDFLTKPVRDQTFLDAVSNAFATDVTRRTESRAAKKYAALFATLTPRERQVIRAVAAGSLNKQIAFDLGISEVTVKLHRSSMMKKMQCTSASQLYVIWQSIKSEIRESE